MSAGGSKLRAIVRDRFGGAVAEKATDALCAALVDQQPLESRLVVEAAGVRSIAPPTAAVLELAPASADVEAPASPVRLAAAVAALGRADVDREALDPVALQLWQALQVRAQRTGFYQRVGTLRAELDRAATSRDLWEVAVDPATAGTTLACWLNQTIRAPATTAALAEVAADSLVERLDVPRAIIPMSAGPGVLVQAADSWRAGGGGRGAGVDVAVVDSEVDLNNPGLRGRVVHRRNYTREPFGWPASHGTAVAGIIAGDTAGYAGIAPDVVVHNYKVIGTDPARGADDFGGALALQHALEDGIRIANCSWGTAASTNGTSREARACDTAWSLGLAIVKSAGNAGPSPGTLTSPADAAGVIVVGATDGAGTAVSTYSSRGPTDHGAPRPHVVAPGGDAPPGSPLDGLARLGVGEIGYGTSFAAPHVTGLLALLIERAPGLHPDDLRDRLVASCVSVGAGSNAEGAGLPELERLLR